MAGDAGSVPCCHPPYSLPPAVLVTRTRQGPHARFESGRPWVGRLCDPAKVCFFGFRPRAFNPTRGAGREEGGDESGRCDWQDCFSHTVTVISWDLRSPLDSVTPDWDLFTGCCDG